MLYFVWYDLIALLLISLSCRVFAKFVNFYAIHGITYNSEKSMHSQLTYIFFMKINNLLSNSMIYFQKSYGKRCIKIRKSTESYLFLFCFEKEKRFRIDLINLQFFCSFMTNILDLDWYNFVAFECIHLVDHTPDDGHTFDSSSIRPYVHYPI